MKLDKTSRFRLQLQKISFTILLLSIVGLLSWLSQHNSVQYDWSANNRNSISQKSIDILNTMDEDIVINVYIKDDEMTHKAVTEILQRYQREKNNFRFSLINPDIDIELAQQDSIKQDGQLVIKYKDKKEILSSLSESVISSALLRLSHTKARNIVFLTGHGERDPAEANNHGYSKLTQQLQTNGFLVKKIHLLKQSITTDTSALVIAGASNELLAGEVEKIKTYLATGGNLLWLVDPGELQGLSDISVDLGLRFHPGIVVDNNIDVRKTLQIEHPAIIPVLEYYPHKITQEIKYNTLFPTSRGIGINSVDSGNNWQAKQLFSSFEQSWSEAGGISNNIIFDSTDGDIAGPINIGVAVERELNHGSNKKHQRIVVDGDSDFLANSYIGAGANLTLGLNMMNWLAGENTLISIEPKGAPDIKLELDDGEVAMIAIGFFVLIPILLILSGFIIWQKRRSA